MGSILSIFVLTIGLQVDSVRLTLSQDSLVVDASNPQIELLITVESLSNNRFLMYSFAKLSEAMDIDAFYCDEDISAANSVFLFDAKGKQQYITVSFNKGIHDRPVTERDLKQNHERLKRQMVSDAIVLPPHSIVQQTAAINLHNFKLKRGEYDLYVIYSSGNRLLDVLGASFVEEQQRELSYGARLRCENPFMVRVFLVGMDTIWRASSFVGMERRLWRVPPCYTS